MTWIVRVELNDSTSVCYGSWENVHRARAMAKALSEYLDPGTWVSIDVLRVETQLEEVFKTVREATGFEGNVEEFWENG